MFGNHRKNCDEARQECKWARGLTAITRDVFLWGPPLGPSFPLQLLVSPHKGCKGMNKDFLLQAHPLVGIPLIILQGKGPYIVHLFYWGVVRGGGGNIPNPSGCLKLWIVPNPVCTMISPIHTYLWQVEFLCKEQEEINSN